MRRSILLYVLISSGVACGGGSTTGDATQNGAAGGAAGTPAVGAGGAPGGMGGSDMPGTAGTAGSSQMVADSGGPMAMDTGVPPDPTLAPPKQVTDFVIPMLPGCAAPYPHDPGVDEKTGLVYYTDSNASCIGQFNPDNMQYKAWPTATAGSYPHGLAITGDGRVFYTGQRVNRVGRVNPTSGMVEDFAVMAQAPHTPVFHKDSIWFTAQSSGQYGRLNPQSGAAEIFNFSARNTGPYGMWPAPDGALWVALFGTNKLARIDTSAATPMSQEFTLPVAASRPRRIAVDGKGRVFYTDYPRRKLGMMDPAAPEANRFQEWDTPGGGRPYGIAIGPDGRVWFDDEDAPEIVGFDPETKKVIAQLPVPIANSGPVRNMAVDRMRKRIWLSVSNVGHLGLLQF